jgi:hypothetical protein
MIDSAEMIAPAIVPLAPVPEWLEADTWSDPAARAGEERR